MRLWLDERNNEWTVYDELLEIKLRTHDEYLARLLVSAPKLERAARSIQKRLLLPTMLSQPDHIKILRMLAEGLILLECKLSIKN